MRRLLPLALLLLLAGCYPPQPFESPLAQPGPLPLPGQVAGGRLYFPYTDGTPVKLGLAGGDAGMVEVLGGSWGYNWSTHGRSANGYEFVPMVWGRFAQAPALPEGTVHALMFNEPDLDGQADMTPGEAAVLAHQLFTLYPAVQWGAPAPSHINPKWIEQYFDTYKCLYGAYPPHAFLTQHCYYRTAARCISEAEAMYDRMRKWNVPALWLTEFAFTEANPNARAEVELLTAWLDAQEWVERWAPFTGRLDCADAKEHGYWDCVAAGDPSLLAADGVTLTEIGSWYAQ